MSVIRTEQGCAQYEGEPQPDCINRSIWNGTCYARADPNTYVVSYRTTNDCYWTPAEDEQVGRFKLYAVPEGTARTDVVRKGRTVGAFSLREASSRSQSISLANTAGPKECLALADIGGEVVDVRGDGSDAGGHLFASPRMLNDKKVAAAQAEVDAVQATLNQSKQQFARLSREVLASPAWRKDRCVLPATSALPPEPKTLRHDEATVHAKGYCMMLLMDQMNAETAMIGAKATQRYDHLRAAGAFGLNITRTAACAQGSYNYPSDEIALLNGEVLANRVPNMPFEPTKEGILGLLVGGAKAILEQATLTSTRRNALVGGLLDQCTMAAKESCLAARVAWEREVLDVRSTPARQLKQCEADLETALEAGKAVKKAEAEVELVTRAARPLPASDPPTSELALSSAVCKIQ